MKLSLDTKLADRYTSSSQKIRVLTEHWVKDQAYCPNCGHLDLDKHINNMPMADFYCSNCREDYELKSKKGNLGVKIVDGAYGTTIKRLHDSDNPNFFLLSYESQTFSILDFLVIPKHFFVPEIIERRKPLSSSARRAGWVGCNILLQSIPTYGKIYFVKDRRVESKEKVINGWKRTLFLRDEKEISAKGWILDILKCIESLDKKEFSLSELYQFETSLHIKHPDNKHIKDKIRQQLQFLRDKGYLEFIQKGRYRLTES